MTHAHSHAHAHSDSHPRAFLALLVAVIATLALHLPVWMGDFYGEPDATSFATDALLWLRGGIRTNEFSNYRYYTSPAYVWVVTLLLPEPGTDIAYVARWLTALNFAASVAVLVPFFFVARRLAGTNAAAIATVVLPFIPTVFQSGLYGFPTLPAEVLLLCAMWAFDRWLDAPPSSSRDVRWLSAVGVCLTASVMLKADVYLGAIALWGLLLVRGRVTWSDAAKLAFTGALPVIALTLVSRALLAQSPDAVAFARDWNTKVVFSRDDLNATHVLQVLKSMGMLTIPCGLAGLAWLARRQRWPLAWMVAAWAVLPIGFWFFRLGDSARHHFPSAFPITIAAAVALAAIPVRALTRGVIIAVLLSVNYFAFRPSADTFTTSGRLVGSARLLGEVIGAHHRTATAFAGQDTPRQVYVGWWRRAYYVDTQVLGRADTVLAYRFIRRHGLPAIEVEYLRGGRRYESTVTYAPLHSPQRARAAAEAYRAEGYRVFTAEFDSTFSRALPDTASRLMEFVPSASPRR